MPLTLSDGTAIQASMSMGLAMSRGGEPLDELLRRADEALFEAKRAGRNRLVIAPFEGSSVSVRT